MFWYQVSFLDTNLNKFLSGIKNIILKKGLDYAPVRFRNELPSSISEHPSFTPKFLRKPPKSNLSWELFLSWIENKLFEVCKSNFHSKITTAGTKYKYNGKSANIRLFLFWYEAIFVLILIFYTKKSCQVWKIKFWKKS